MLIESLKKIRRKLVPTWLDSWPKLLEKAKTYNCLQLGSGISTPIPGSINVDINPVTQPQVLFDLNEKIWPFIDNSFDMIVAISILEHLDDFFAAMSEIHRIAKPGASVYILVPHFSSAAAFVDPTHRQMLSARSLDYLISETTIEKNYGFYYSFRFRQIKRFVELAGLWNYFLPAHWLCNHKVAFWEEYLCYMIRGAGVYWELQVLKPCELIGKNK